MFSARAFSTVRPTGVFILVLILCTVSLLSTRVVAKKPGVLPILSGPDFPIGLWWPPPPEATTVDRYREIKDAGFTFVIGGNRTVNTEFSRHMLEVAEANGLKVIVTDERIEQRSFSRRFLDEEREFIQSVADDYMDYPAFAGLNFFDEPGTQLFASLAVGTGIFKEIASEKIAYINLFPSYVVEGSLRAPDYETYINRFVSEVEPQLISFDHYPLLESDDGAITDDYFYNWSVIRQAALEADVPSWIFIQSVDYIDHRLPTESEILWQINVSLAYGAKGVMYFTYWTPYPNPERFGTALVSPAGRLTPLYDYAKRVNETIAAVGRQLLPLTSESVMHFEDTLPDGAAPFVPNEWVAGVTGSSMIVGQFHQTAADGLVSFDGDALSSRWVLLVNRSFHESAQNTIALSDEVKAVSVYDPQLDEYVAMPLDDDAIVEVSLSPGAAILYRLDK